MSEAARRTNLRDFVVSRYDDVSSGNTTHAQLLGESIDLAVRQVRNDYGITYEDSQHAFANRHAVTEAVVDDLFSVYVGDHVWGRWRGSGDFWHNLDIDPRRGATGFRDEFLDNTDQLQHTVAGLWAGYHKNSLLEAIANLREEGIADLAINHVTIPLGNNINDLNIDQLGLLLLEALGTPEAVATYLGETVRPECFGPDTPIDMWPLEPEFAPDPSNPHKVFDQDAVRAKVWKKPIAMIRKGDIVVSFDENDNLMPGRVSRTFENESKILLDYFGTRVTPGHVYFRPDSKKADKFECLLDILRDDGMIQNVEGENIRAATNVPVGDPCDGFVWAVTQERSTNGSLVEKDRGRIRLGTRFIVDGQTSKCVADVIETNGGIIGEDELIRFGDGEPEPFVWEHGATLPKPEAFVLEASGTTLEDIYKASEWESRHPQMPAPMVLDGGPVQPLSARELAMMPRNQPLNLDPVPSLNRAGQPTMNRKQRKAMEAKQRKAAKTRKRLAG